MKAIVAIALLFAVAVSAQSFCVELTKDDVTCEGHRANFPAKICYPLNQTVSSASYCDQSAYYNAWVNACPLKNSGNVSFCDGTGYALAYLINTNPCVGLIGCSSDADCNATPEPSAPVAFVPFCYDCCLYCFDDAACQEKVGAANAIYTNSTTCTQCKPAEPVAAPTAGNPTTPGTSNTPSKKSTGAVVVVSGIVLAFSALLF